MIIFFLSEQKRNLFSAGASANTSTTTDLKHLVHLNPIFLIVLFVAWVENFKPNRELKIIRNARHRIHSTTVYSSILFSLTKTISTAKNLIYFHTVYTSVFSSGVYRCLDSARFFSTVFFRWIRAWVWVEGNLLGGNNPGDNLPGGNFPNTKLKYALDF